MDKSWVVRESKRQSPLVAINIMLLATITAVLTLLLVSPAFGDAVDCTDGQNCRIRFIDYSGQVRPVQHADYQWSRLGAVRVVPVDKNPNLVLSKAHAGCEANWVGYYSDGDPATIQFNTCNYQKYNYTLFHRKGTATHEFGHALGIGLNGHLPSPNVMYSPSSSTGNNTPQAGDRRAYRNFWGY